MIVMTYNGYPVSILTGTKNASDIRIIEWFSKQFGYDEMGLAISRISVSEYSGPRDN